jgi:hypothetical protein
MQSFGGWQKYGFGLVIPYFCPIGWALTKPLN